MIRAAVGSIAPALAAVIAVIAVTAKPGVSRAEGCLEAQNTFVVLNFVASDSDDSRIIERVIQDDRRGWIVRRCEDPRLLDKIKRGDKAQLEQLLNRRIILAVFQDGVTIRHHVIPYAYKQVASGHEVPMPAGFGMCPSSRFDFEEVCKRYAGPVRALLAAAVALYKLNFSTCPELEDANASINEALGGLAKLGEASPRKELRDFVIGQRDELRAKVAALRCGPRALNARLMEDRKSSLFTQGVWNTASEPR